MQPPTSQNPKEFQRLLASYKIKQPKNVLEIGTHEGGTLYYWLQHGTPGTKVLSIDDQQVNWRQYSDWCAPGVTVDYKLAKSEDKEAVDFVSDKVDGLDWLFIDGGHLYHEVKGDFEVYTRYMKEGGIVALHDICSYPPYSSDVDIYWAEIKREYNCWEIIEPQDEGFGFGPGIGVVYL